MVLVFRGEPLEERSFALEEDRPLRRRPTRVTLGQGRDDTFAVPAGPLSPSFPLLRAAGGAFVLSIAECMAGKLHLAGETLSVAEFFVQRRGVAAPQGAPGAGVREQVLGPADWGILSTDGTGAVALFFQFLPPPGPVTDLRPRSSSRYLPFNIDPFFQKALLISAAVHLALLVLMLAAREPRLTLAIEPPATARLARLLVDRKREAERLREREPAAPGKPGPAGMSDLLLLQHRLLCGELRPLLSDDQYALAAPAEPAPAPVQSKAVPAPVPVPDPIRPPPALEKPAPRPVSKAATKPSRPAAPRSAAPEVISGAPYGQGTLNRGQLDKVVSAHQNEILECYRRELQQSPKLAGKLLLVWNVDAAGSVSHVRTEGSTVGRPSLDACIVQHAQKWRFPASRGATLNTSVPFIFRHP